MRDLVTPDGKYLYSEFEEEDRPCLTDAELEQIRCEHTEKERHEEQLRRIRSEMQYKWQKILLLVSKKYNCDVHSAARMINSKRQEIGLRAKRGIPLTPELKFLDAVTRRFIA